MSEDSKYGEKHPYHCVLDGEQLKDAGLGLLACPKCDTYFVPTMSDDGDSSLSWKTKDLED